MRLLAAGRAAMRLLALLALLAIAYTLVRLTRAPQLEERPRVPEDVYVLSLWERVRCS